MALPVAKLGTLALRTLSKPIASRLKSQAALHPKFRNFIVAIAQINHRITTKIQRRVYGHATDVEIRPLDEQKALQAATDLIGEAFIFSVAVAALFFEVQRSARSEARKEEARRREIEELKQREDSLAKELEDLKLKLNEIERLAKGRGLTGILNLKGVHGAEGSKAATISKVRRGTDMTGGGGAGGGACAVCKHQRRKCEPNCELAAYFPAHRMNDFRALHLVFGVANLTKLVIKANATDAARRRAAETLTWEARWRERDPAEGCYREVACLRRDNALLRSDNAALRRQLADHRHLLLCWSSTTTNMAAGGGNGQLVSVRPPPPSHTPAPPPSPAAMRDHPYISSRDNKSSNPRC